jgi:hypothetical protein
MSSASSGGIPFKEDEGIQTKKPMLARRADIYCNRTQRQKELDNKNEIHALAESIKAVHYQEYKMTSCNRRQGSDNKEEEPTAVGSHFDYII